MPVDWDADLDHPDMWPGHDTVTTEAEWPATVHLIQRSDGAPVEGVHRLGDPLAVGVVTALPSVVVQRHQAEQAGAGGHGQVQPGQLVVVQGDRQQAGQAGEHWATQPAQAVVVQIEELQSVQSSQVLRLNLFNLIMAEIETSQGWQTQECSVAETWNEY